MPQQFSSITSLPMPLIRDNVDTDQIIPSREMKSTGKTGLSDGLFAGWRYTEIGGRKINDNFVMNDPDFADSQIILGGTNFGCGSSREHAVWALAEYGFRAVIAPSFAPIFAGNCIRNGVLPAVLDEDAIAEVAKSHHPVTIDLPEQDIHLPGVQTWSFPLEDEAKMMLLEGLDAIDLSLKQADAIATWQTADHVKRPWIYLGTKQ